MTLYDERITTVSLDALKTIADMIDFPVCVCGGWAVYFTVNEFFKEKKERTYIGSQDIDIGFSISPMSSKSELSSTTLLRMLDILESKGFQPEGFRYKKEMTLEGQKKKSFVLYVDILVNSYPPSLYDIYPNCFFEVPLIEQVYSDKGNQVSLQMISENLFMPTRPILTAMKIKSFPSRGQSHHKKIKDLCDLYSLLWFSNTSIHQNMNDALLFTDTQSLRRVKETIQERLVEECERYIGEPKGSIGTTLQIIDTYI